MKSYAMRPMRRSLLALSMLLACSACTNEVETAVKAKLNDPDSAQFSEISTKDGVTCGLVNAKNKFGGYVGRRAFIYAGGKVHFQDSEGFNSFGYEACTMTALSAAIQATHEEITQER